MHEVWKLRDVYDMVDIKIEYYFSEGKRYKGVLGGYYYFMHI